MKKYAILVLILAILVSFTVVSCSSQAKVTQTGKPAQELPLKKAEASGAKDTSKLSSTAVVKESPDKAAAKIENEQEGVEQEGQDETPEMTWEQLDEVYRQNDEALAMMKDKNYTAALEILTGLAAKFPAEVSFKYNITCAYSLMGEKDKAIDYLIKTMQAGWFDWQYMDSDSDLDNIRNEEGYKKVRQALEVLYPESVKALPRQGCSCCEEKEIDEAKETDEENEKEQTFDAGKIFEELNDMNREVMELLQAKNYEKALEIIRSLDEKCPNNGGINYNTACVYSLMGDKANAISSLRKSIKFGYFDWKHMDEDTDLNNIREETEYKDIRHALEVLFPDNDAMMFIPQIVPGNGAVIINQNPGGCKCGVRGGCKCGGGAKNKEGGCKCGGGAKNKEGGCKCGGNDKK